MKSFCAKISESEHFQSLVLMLIVATSVGLGLETIPELNERYGMFFVYLHDAAQYVFALEILLRLGAFLPRPLKFFSEGWNRFDFVLVALSFVPIIGSLSTSIRILRVLRLLRVFSVSDHLRGFFDRLSTSFDEILFSGFIVGVLSYIFTIIGYYCFGTADPVHWGTFSGAYLSVFYLFIFQNVPQIVEALFAQSKLSLVYFATLYLVVVGLFVSVLVAAVSQSVRDDQNGKN